MWGCTLPWCIYNLCSLKLQSVQRIILDRWLRKALPILYILSLQIDVQSCLFAKSIFFPPNHFLRLAGVYPPGWALKISANKKEGAWLNHQRNPAAHTQAILNPPFPVRPVWNLPGRKTPLGSGTLRALPSQPQNHPRACCCLLIQLLLSFVCVGAFFQQSGSAPAAEIPVPHHCIYSQQRGKGCLKFPEADSGSCLS